MINIWPLAHFFWGYSITLPLFIALFWIVKKNLKVKNTKDFLKKRAVFGVVGGFWAMIPDIDYFLDDHIFSDKSFSDIFCFHISLDKVLPETDLFFAGEMLLIFAVVNLFALVIVVETFWRLNETIFGKKEEEDEEEEDEDNKDEEGDEGEENDIGKELKEEEQKNEDEERGEDKKEVKVEGKDHEKEPEKK